jgi:hypothetical protein
VGAGGIGLPLNAAITTLLDEGVLIFDHHRTVVVSNGSSECGTPSSPRRVLQLARFKRLGLAPRDVSGSGIFEIIRRQHMTPEEWCRRA